MPLFVVAHAVDPEGDTVLYDIQVATDLEMTDVVAEVTDLVPGAGDEGTLDQTSWRPAEAFGTGTFYWTARAVDADGMSTDADEVWSFEMQELIIGDDDDDDDDDRTGCDCQSSVVGASPASRLALLLLLLVPAVRRRR